MNLIVGRILNLCPAEMILLFGSFARGEQNKYSDIDLVVVTSSKVQKKQVERQIKSSIKRYGVRTDVLVKTKVEIHQALSEPGSFLRSVVLEGKTLYKKDGFFLEF